jgi:hypothetical protein
LDSARFTEPERYIRWPLAGPRDFLDRKRELRTTLQSLVSRDLAEKLERALLDARDGS